MYLTQSNTKIQKSIALGWNTYGLHLSPHKQNSTGKNLCPKATDECIALCLNKAGRGVFSNVTKSRIRKSDEFIKDPYLFLEKLYGEISKIEANRKLTKEKVAIRLNMTSDIPWENMKLYSINGKNLMETFPKITFYDYSKVFTRINNLPKNYSLTYSYSGENEIECKDVLSKGYGVSIVFADKIPKTYWNYKVINGDESDARFLDKKLFKIKKNEGYIIGLKFKKVKHNLDLNTSKFVITI